MQSKLFRRQRVAILDPDLRGREHARRVIRATGHAPYVFASIEEMQEVDVAERPFAMAYLGCALGDEEIEQTVQDVRACLGDTLPLLLAVKSVAVRRVAQAPTIAADHVIPLQPRFTELFLELSDFMWAHGPQPQQTLLSWGEFRFRPAARTVQIGEAAPMSLPIFHFELALELFHNVGRSLSRRWLNTMLAPPSRAISAVSLQDAVSRLRHLLNLQKPAAWQIQSLEDGAVRLAAIAPETDLPTLRAPALRLADRVRSGRDVQSLMTLS
jgi:DNA-binding response OmpR family regulator